ncbi:MAG: hypothetical protein ACD_50C00373G0001 [uncultured bacterium]|nr:MAG: hypothetical protein ACD_50C00373G0001 [uncultured bacterium]
MQSHESKQQKVNVTELIRIAKEHDDEAFTTKLAQCSKQEIDAFVKETIGDIGNLEQVSGLIYVAAYNSSETFIALWNQASPLVREEALKSKVDVDILLNNDPTRLTGLQIIYARQRYEALNTILKTTDPFVIAECKGNKKDKFFALEAQYLNPDQRQTVEEKYLNIYNCTKHPKMSITNNSNEYIKFMEEQINFLQNDWLREEKQDPLQIEYRNKIHTNLLKNLNKASDALFASFVPQNNNETRLRTLEEKLNYVKNCSIDENKNIEHWSKLATPYKTLNKDEQINYFNQMFEHSERFKDLTPGQCQARALQFLLFIYKKDYSSDIINKLIKDKKLSDRFDEAGYKTLLLNSAIELLKNAKIAITKQLGKKNNKKLSTALENLTNLTTALSKIPLKNVEFDEIIENITKIPKEINNPLASTLIREANQVIKMIPAVPGYIPKAPEKGEQEIRGEEENEIEGQREPPAVEEKIKDIPEAEEIEGPAGELDEQGIMLTFLNNAYVAISSFEDQKNGELVNQLIRDIKFTRSNLSEEKNGVDELQLKMSQLLTQCENPGSPEYQKIQALIEQMPRIFTQLEAPKEQHPSGPALQFGKR